MGLMHLLWFQFNDIHHLQLLLTSGFPVVKGEGVLEAYWLVSRYHLDELLQVLTFATASRREHSIRQEQGCPSQHLRWALYLAATL